MPVFLTTSHARLTHKCRYRCRIGQSLGSTATLPPGLGVELERAFDAIRDDWEKLARHLSRESSAGLAHTPTCAANVSDFGLMLAWSRIVKSWALRETSVHVVCDDPWMFRHLAGLADVRAGSSPWLWAPATRLFLRGYLARFKATLANLFARILLPRATAKGGTALLVYGHPRSAADGTDAYFGELMTKMDGLRRVLHVDCFSTRAKALASPTTSSLHAWGPICALFTLPFVKWRPGAQNRRGKYGWLVRRAAAIEGSTGQAAMIAWQLACQKAWLEATRPNTVCWPWENHAWERAFVRDARVFGVRTVGYQHTVVGNREWNYAAGTNPDGLASLPESILTSGREGADILIQFGIPGDRLNVAGALRGTQFKSLLQDPNGPVFVALPFDADIAGQIVSAIRPLGAQGMCFLVKTHPMTPFPFIPSDGIVETKEPLERQGGVSAVLYAATTVGLEAALGGLPTLRFRPVGKVPADAVPSELNVATVNATDLAAELRSLAYPTPVDTEHFLATPDYALWQRVLGTESAPHP